MKGKIAQELNAQKLPSFRGLGFGNNTSSWNPGQSMIIKRNRLISFIKHNRGLKRSILKHMHADGTIAKTHGIFNGEEFMFPKRK